MNPDKRTLVLFAIPVGLVYIIWAIYMFSTASWALFQDDWYTTLTMIFGSVIAGASSEGVNFWLVCIAVMMLGAPFGAYVLAKINRTTIAYILYFIILAQFAAALLIIRPLGTLLTALEVTFIVGMMILFGLTYQSKRAAS